MSREARVRVFVADGHPIYREGLARAVRERPELELVGEASDGRDALAELRRLVPDVAIIDLALPELDGTQVLRAASRDGIGSRVIVLAENHDSAAAFRAIESGAAGCLTKNSDKDAICRAVAAAARGQTVLSPEIQTGIAGQIRMRAVDDRPLLTMREREILPLIAEGRYAVEIGRQLHLSAATVKTHLHHLYRKLGVSDRAAAVAEAMRRGLVE